MKLIYTPTSSWETPIIEDDEITSEYEYKINYGQIDLKMHHKAKEAPEHKIVFPNSCSFTMVIDLPHNVLNKLDDYTLDYGPLTYETSASNFKESYILPSRPPWDQVDYIVSASYAGTGSSLTFVSQSNGDILIIGDDFDNGIIQEPYCNINVPFLVDASGSRIDANLEITTKKVTGKDVDIYRYSVDQIWLDNAVYPVIIDPTITLYSTSNVALIESVNTSVTRASNGNLIVVQGERTTWRIRVYIGNGDNMSNPTIVNVATGTTFLDFGNILRADDGRLVCIYRDRNGANNVKSKYSVDNGLTWTGEATFPNGPWSANGVTVIKDQDGTLWAQTENSNVHLFKSTNNGTSWTLETSGQGFGKWYGDVCEDRKNRKLIVSALDNTTGTIAYIRVWDIDVGSYDAGASALPTTGYPSHDYALQSGIDCDLEGNVIIMMRIRYTSDSLWRLWEHKWPAGTSAGSATGSLVTVNGQSQVYGNIQTDRDGLFHKNVVYGSGNFGMWYSKGTFNQDDSYKKVYDPSPEDNSRFAFYIDPFNKDSISEFHLFPNDYDGSSYYLKYNDDNVKKVGPTIMGSIG